MTGEARNAASRFHPDGAVIVKKSQAEKPYYLCRVINAWDEHRHYGEHLLIGEEFATRNEAEARAKELSRV